MNNEEYDEYRFEKPTSKRLSNASLKIQIVVLKGVVSVLQLAVCKKNKQIEQLEIDNAELMNQLGQLIEDINYAS